MDFPWPLLLPKKIRPLSLSVFIGSESAFFVFARLSEASSKGVNWGPYLDIWEKGAKCSRSTSVLHKDDQCRRVYGALAHKSHYVLCGVPCFDLCF